MNSGTGLVAAPQSPLRGVVAALVILALAAIVSPSLSASASNLLVNGSMETYTTYGTDPGTGTPLTVATGWTRFVESGNPKFIGNSGFVGSVWGSGWSEGYDGSDCQMIFTTDGSSAYVAGLYQQIHGATAGVAYAFSGRIATKGDHVNTGRKLGIDPYGGTDPRSPNVVWGDESWANGTNHWQNIFVAAIARNTTVTVFLRVNNPGEAAPMSEAFLDAFMADVAPVAHVNALAPFLGSAAFPVSWVLDSIPSGATFVWPDSWFQVQLRDGGGAWQNWQAKTPDSSAAYPGANCHTYYFQARALVMPDSWRLPGSRLPSFWPGGDGQAHTSVISELPSSQVNALAGTQRCTQFPVTWTGAAGSCGISGYDVQVRDGAGSWTDWLLGITGNSANFHGVDGHTYAFRSRAHGFGGYLEPYGDTPDASTTVAFAPPVASVSLLPPVQVAATFPITWSGGAAGCGIAGFDVFIRSIGLTDDLDTGWRPWRTNTQSLGATFSGAVDTYYSFRVRARDTVGNVSEASVSTSILSAPRAVLAGSSLVAEPAFPRPGDIVIYRLTVSNQGNVESNARITQTLPVDHMTLLTETVQASWGTAQISDSGIAWNGELDPGATMVITSQMRLDESVGLGTYVSKTAQIQDGERSPIWRTATILAPYQAFLPLVANVAP